MRLWGWSLVSLELKSKIGVKVLKREGWFSSGHSLMDSGKLDFFMIFAYGTTERYWCAAVRCAFCQLKRISLGEPALRTQGFVKRNNQNTEKILKQFWEKKLDHGQFLFWRAPFHFGKLQRERKCPRSWTKIQLLWKQPSRARQGCKTSNDIWKFGLFTLTVH